MLPNASHSVAPLHFVDGTPTVEQFLRGFLHVGGHLGVAVFENRQQVIRWKATTHDRFLEAASGIFEGLAAQLLLPLSFLLFDPQFVQPPLLLFALPSSGTRHQSPKRFDPRPNQVEDQEHGNDYRLRHL
jgi:hypothetical protein